MNKNIPIFNVFSGNFYEIPEKDIDLLDDIQIPLKKYPSKSCKTCNGRGYTGKDSNNFFYFVCKCVIKVIDQEKIKSLTHQH